MYGQSVGKSQDCGPTCQDGQARGFMCRDMCDVHYVIRLHLVHPSPRRRQRSFRTSTSPFLLMSRFTDKTAPRRSSLAPEYPDGRSVPYLLAPRRSGRRKRSTIGTPSPKIYPLCSLHCHGQSPHGYIRICEDIYTYTSKLRADAARCTLRGATNERFSRRGLPYPPPDHHTRTRTHARTTSNGPHRQASHTRYAMPLFAVGRSLPCACRLDGAEEGKKITYAFFPPPDVVDGGGLHFFIGLSNSRVGAPQIEWRETNGRLLICFPGRFEAEPVPRGPRQWTGPASGRGGRQLARDGRRLGLLVVGTSGGRDSPALP